MSNEVFYYQKVSTDAVLFIETTVEVGMVIVDGNSVERWWVERDLANDCYIHMIDSPWPHEVDSFRSCQRSHAHIFAEWLANSLGEALPAEVCGFLANSLSNHG